MGVYPMSSYETCRSCGAAPCECPRRKPLTVATWRGQDPCLLRVPLRWIDWFEFVLVTALVWVVVVGVPLPGTDGGCLGGSA